MKLTALKTFRHGSTVYRRTEQVEMSEARMKPLIEKKLVGEPPPVAMKKAKINSED